ncbi:MAG: PKD domain-containing protein [Euryarchaeota archaeon]|nr:PKD domain-containing protein [Euryarchaeota archaeon]MDE2043940.1 PKD domain-containing protein [Thermoplasmata archaeon]
MAALLVLLLLGSVQGPTRFSGGTATPSGFPAGGPNPSRPFVAEVNGVDTSHYETVTNWTNVLSAGYKFDFTKATQGASFVDPTFTTYMPAGKAAGLWMAGYDFACPATDSSVGCIATNATTEANHYLSIAAPYFSSGYLYPALDLEEGCGTISNNAMSTWVDMWMSTVQQYIAAHDGYTGVTPVLYTGVSEVTGCLDPYLTTWPLWIANWGVSSPNTGIWPTWTFWQHSATGTVPGISGTSNVDLDYFQGDTAQLASGYVFGNLTTSPPTISFFVHPATCPIAFNGTSQGSGSTGSYVAGTYSIVANPCTDFSFQQWNSTGGVTVQRPTSAGGFANVTGTGSLTAYYTWSGKTLHAGNVTFVISPPACGPVIFGGLNENNGARVQFTDGNYSANALTCLGYSFSKWTATGSLTLPSLGGNPTTVGVWGNGTLTASYTWVPPPAHYTISFQVSPAACSPVSFNGTTQATGSVATFLGGRYPVHALPCTGETFSQTTFQMPAGRSQILTNSWGNVSVSTNGSLWVNYTTPSTPLSVGLTPSSVSATVGQSVTLTPTVSGGVSPYTCAWSLNGTNTSLIGCGGSALSFAHPGTYTYRVWATDASSTVAGSNSVAITVAASSGGQPPQLVAFGNASATSGSLTGSCNGGALSPFVDSFEGSARGGAPAYAFSWTFGDGSSPQTGRNVSHSFGSVGSYSVSLEVTDTRSTHAWSNTSVTVVGPAQPPCDTQQAPGFSLLGLSTTMSLVLIVVVIALAISVPAVVLVQRRRRPPTPPPWPVQPGPPPGFPPQG